MSKASIPRGFSRYYILHLLKEKGTLTGKEIIDEAERRSEGAWRPSPGLVYPLLGRLLSDGLIEETEDGRHRLTAKGEVALKDYAKIQEEMDRRLEVVRRLGVAGKILAEDTLDRLMTLAKGCRSEISKTSSEARDGLLKKYKAFLESELERLREER